MFILFLITHLLIQSAYAQTATPSASIVLTISPPVVKTTLTPTLTPALTLSITPTPTLTPILTPAISVTVTPSATTSATATPSSIPNTPTPMASSSSATVTSPTPTLTPTPIPVVKTITQFFAPDTVFPESFLKLERDRSLYSSQEITPSAIRSLLLEAIISLLLGLLLIFWEKVSVLVAQLTSRNHWEYITINE